MLVAESQKNDGQLGTERQTDGQETNPAFGREEFAEPKKEDD